MFIDAGRTDIEYSIFLADERKCFHREIPVVATDVNYPLEKLLNLAKENNIQIIYIDVCGIGVIVYDYFMNNTHLTDSWAKNIYQVKTVS
jgi:hypothetical protein